MGTDINGKFQKQINPGVWGILTEAVPDILPKGTLIHQYSNVLIGVIVRYPTKKIRLQTS